VEEAAAGGRQRAVHQGQEEQRQGAVTGQGDRAVPADLAAADVAGVAHESLSCSDARELRKLVDHDHPELSVSRQCALLGRQLACQSPVDPQLRSPPEAIHLTGEVRRQQR